MDINCPKCRRQFHIEQKYPFHAGFGNVGFLYCNNCPNLAVFSSFDPHYISLVGKVHPWTLTTFKKWKVQKHLKPCPCGGRFRFAAKPRCPLCKKHIPSILPGSIYYLETGDSFDDDKVQIWKTLKQNVGAGLGA